MTAEKRKPEKSERKITDIALLFAVKYGKITAPFAFCDRFDLGWTAKIGPQIVVGVVCDENDVFVQYVTVNIEDIKVGDCLHDKIAALVQVKRGHRFEYLRRLSSPPCEHVL